MKKLTLLLIILVIFVIPFFWLKPGEVNLGGDSSRLYFYDPLSYLNSSVLYGVAPGELGVERLAFFYIPFVSLLIFLKSFLSSPTTLINFFNSCILAISFLSIYLIVNELLKDLKSISEKAKYLAAVTGGLFYVLTPAFSFNFDKPLISQNQIFLNPLIFFLILKLINSQKIVYGLAAILIAFIFAPNFSFTSAPPFFAFYPLAIFYLLIYAIFIKKISFSFKFILIFLFFILTQSFHLIPQSVQLFDKESIAAQRVFSKVSSLEAPLNVFPDIKLFNNLLAHPQSLFGIETLFFIFPTVLIFGLLLNSKKKNLNFLILSIFLLISTFLITANITGLGLSLYRLLFKVPGFSMFRNFSGQFAYVFYFFYTLIFSISLCFLLNGLNKKVRTAVFLIIITIIIFNALPFIKGDMLRQPFFQGKEDINGVFIMDPNFEKVLSYVKNSKEEGKYLTLPLTDTGYEVIKGKNNGAYIGPSVIGYLGGKNDFPGIDGFRPYQDILINLIKNNDVERINNLFNYLNIKYIFYSSNPYIYDSFSKFPFEQTKKYFPNQKSINNFMLSLADKKVFEEGAYSIYTIKSSNLSHIYATARGVYSSSPLDASIKSFIEPIVVHNSNTQLKNVSEVILFAENNSVFSNLKDNYHLHMHDPFVSTKPGDITYQFMLIKENNDLNNKRKNPDEYVDYSLLYSAKRITEIILWGSEISYGENGMDRFKNQIKTLTKYIENSDNSKLWKETNKIKIKEQLLYQKQKLIESSNIPIDVIQNDFSTLLDDCKINSLNTNSYSYEVQIPDKGLYSIEAQTKNTLPDIRNNTYIKIDNQTYYPININDRRIYFGDINFDTGEKNLIFNLNFPIPNNTAIEYVSDNQKELSWNSDTQYYLSFEYKTVDDLKFSLFDKTDNSSRNKKLLLKRNLDSNNWNMIEEFFSTEEFSKGGIFLVESYKTNNMPKLEIKNFKLIEIPDIEVILNKKQVNNIKETPSIEVEKVNPTKYKIRVSNSKYQYYLVLSEAFNKNWKLYALDLENKDTNFNTVILRIFDGLSKAFLENSGENGFLNSKTFETIFYKEFSEDKHFVSSGYANAWFITPDDIDNKDNYELIIELSSQRSFYIFMFISLISVLIILIMFLVNLITYNKGRYKK